MPDVKGGKLLLTKTTLTELTGYQYGPFRLQLVALKLRKTGTMVRATLAALRNTGATPRAYVVLDYVGRILGCRTFTRVTFAKIMKMAEAL